MSIVLSPTPPIAGEPDLVGRLAPPEARRGGPHRANPAVVDTFKGVARYWSVEAFEPRAVFGDREHAAMFGRFTYCSTTPGKQVTSPFAVYAHVVDGKCVYLQFMEDTFATTESFLKGGEWLIHRDPDGGEGTIWAGSRRPRSPSNTTR